MRNLRFFAGAVLLMPLAVNAQQALPPVIQPETAAIAAPSSASLEGRVGRLERLLDSRALIEIVTRLDQLQFELQELRGELELLGRDVGTLKQRQRDLYVDVDRRLRRLELATTNGVTPTAPAPVPFAETTPPATVVASPPAAAAPDTTTTPVAAPTPAADPLQEQASYQAAFELLKEGRYAESIESFQAFLDLYPGGNYADNAQYWLGEANYVTRDFETSVAEFRKVLDLYPSSPKVPDAMLKLGYAYYEKQEWASARAILTDLRQKYPSATAARLAANRLKRMASEGR